MGKALFLWCLAGVIAFVGLGVLYFRWDRNHREDQGFQCLEADRPEAALEIFTRLLAESPTNVRALEGQSMALLKQEKIREALPFVRRWIQADSASVKALRTLFGILDAFSEFEEAKKVGEKLLDLDPHDQTTKRKLAAVYLSLGEYDASEELLRELLESQPKDLGLTKLLAEVSRGKGDIEGAVRLYQQFVFRQPENYAAQMGLAVMLHESQRSAEAVPLFQRVIERDPSRKRTARYHLGLALSRLGRVEEAQKLMEEVRQYQLAEGAIDDLPLRPSDPDLMLRASRGYFIRKEPQKALELLRRLLHNHPDFAPAHQLLADHYEEIGDLPNATAHRQKAKRSP